MSHSQVRTSSATDCNLSSPPATPHQPLSPSGKSCDSHTPMWRGHVWKPKVHAITQRTDRHSGARAWISSLSVPIEWAGHSRKRRLSGMKPTSLCVAWCHLPRQWKSWSCARRPEWVGSLSSLSARHRCESLPHASRPGTCWKRAQNHARRSLI